jgi:hypothetical protein
VPRHAPRPLPSTLAPPLPRSGASLSISTVTRLPSASVTVASGLLGATKARAGGRPPPPVAGGLPGTAARGRLPRPSGRLAQFYCSCFRMRSRGRRRQSRHSHSPWGSDSMPAHVQWNHCVRQSALSHAIMSPWLTSWQ